MLIFDIGANVGRWALANEKGNTILAVEASPKTFEELTKNVKGYENIQCVQAAVSSNPGTHITFYECSRAHVLSTLDKEWLTSHESRFQS